MAPRASDPTGPGCPEAPGRRRASGPQTSACDVTCPSSPSPPPAWAAWSTPGLCCPPPSVSDVPGFPRATLLLGKRARPRRPASGQRQVQGLRGRQQSVSESLVQAWGTAFIDCLRGPHPRNPTWGCLLRAPPCADARRREGTALHPVPVLASVPCCCSHRGSEPVDGNFLSAVHRDKNNTSFAKNFKNKNKTRVAEKGHSLNSAHRTSKNGTLCVPRQELMTKTTQAGATGRMRI